MARPEHRFQASAVANSVCISHESQKRQSGISMRLPDILVTVKQRRTHVHALSFPAAHLRRSPLTPPAWLLQDQTLAQAATGGFIVNPACFFMMAQDLLASMRHSGVDISARLPPPPGASGSGSQRLFMAARTPSHPSGTLAALDPAGGGWRGGAGQPLAEGRVIGPPLLSEHQEPTAGARHPWPPCWSRQRHCFLLPSHAISWFEVRCGLIDQECAARPRARGTSRTPVAMKTKCVCRGQPRSALPCINRSIPAGGSGQGARRQRRPHRLLLL